jgi:hypothetical protein
VQEVRDLLGEPEATSGRGLPGLWRYGPLEIGFFRSSRDEMPFVASISLYFRNSDEALPETLGVAGWFPPVGSPYVELRSRLDQAGIPVVGGVTAGPTKHLVVGPGVRITFDADLLHSIQYYAKREPPFKQLSISIPREDLDLIRREARSRSVSVSSLCSTWVRERARELAESNRSSVANRPV